MTWTASSQDQAALRSYLLAKGWREGRPGTAGSLWSRSGAVEATIAVPSQIGDNEWAGLIDRIARAEGIDTTSVEHTIRFSTVDVVRFRAVNNHAIGDSISLFAGIHLVDTAYRTLRAAATTARKPKSQIRGNFSRAGDRIVQAARMGHSEVGSYVLPVFVPLDIDFEDPADEALLQVEGRALLEPMERRVTRTLAQAFAALNDSILTPAIEPTSRSIVPLVHAGASREFVVAIEESVANRDIASVEVSFNWAAAAQAPTAVPASVTVPGDAAPLLTKAANLMRTVRRDPLSVFTGVIVEVRHEPDDPTGEIGLQTMRNGRQVELRVRLDAETLNKSHDWMRSRRTVLVDGVVSRDQRLRVENPVRVLPLDETFLPIGDARTGSN
ncbi:MAG: hypothetical protein FWD55_08890 [Propionibacteriaceae bacterium]|nr:hypothetical protein [Propionibacteriaceae bacterium]